MTENFKSLSDAKMLMMALLPPMGLLGSHAGGPGGVNGSWEKTWMDLCECSHPRARSFSDQ